MSEITPQFGKAEYSNVPGTERCGLCQQLIGASYYRLNGKMACTMCAERAKSGIPVESGSAYTKALLFGAGAAFLGFVLYSAVSIMTGLQIGYMSLAVGFLVGIAMKKGAGGVGGRKYQITAAVLTYAAVSMSALPIYFYMEKDKLKSDKVVQQQAKPATDSSSSADDNPTPAQNSDAAKAKTPSTMGFGTAIALLLGIGLASPFLKLAASPLNGLIGLVILYVGINFAWKQTASPPLAVDGPYDNGPRLATASAG